MTRGEEIVNAARTMAERHQIAEMELYGGDKCNYSYGRICNSEITSFEAGAKWADVHPDLSSLWHDAAEEPQGYYWKILCQDEEGGCWVENRANAMLSHNNWDEYAAVEMIVKWAYINDLLPKNK